MRLQYKGSALLFSFQKVPKPSIFFQNRIQGFDWHVFFALRNRPTILVFFLFCWVHMSYRVGIKASFVASSHVYPYSRRKWAFHILICPKNLFSLCKSHGAFETFHITEPLFARFFRCKRALLQQTTLTIETRNTLQLYPVAFFVRSNLKKINHLQTYRIKLAALEGILLKSFPNFPFPHENLK